MARVRLVMFAGFAVIAIAGGVVSWLWYRQYAHEASSLQPEVLLTPDQQTKLDAARAETRKKIEQFDAPWRAAIEAIEPATVTGEPCDALSWAEAGLEGNPQTSDWGAWRLLELPLSDNGSSTFSFTHAPFPLNFSKRGAELPRQSPEALARLAELAASEKATWQTFEERLASARFTSLSTSDVLVQFDELVEPKLEQQNRFEPGRVSARAWVFDHRVDRVVCAGSVRAENSATVSPGSSNLNDDLLINLVRALPKSLLAIPAPDSLPAGLASAPRGSAASPTSANGVAKLAPFAFKDFLGGAPAVMRFGRVVQHAHTLEISLANDRDPGCGEVGQSDDAYFSFALLPGPGGNYYAGHSYGVAASAGHRGQSGSGLAAQYLAFEVEPFQLLPGAHVHGKIRTLGAGEGSFDATVCPSITPAELTPLPRAAAPTPFSGTVSGQSFAVKSALAVVLDEGNSSELSSLDLFDAPGVSCSSRVSAHALRVRFSDIGGASSVMHLTGSPQPAKAAATPAGQASLALLGPEAVWVQLDSLNFTTGNKISGSAVVDHAASTSKASGTFSAIVCKP